MEKLKKLLLSYVTLLCIITSAIARDDLYKTLTFPGEKAPKILTYDQTWTAQNDGITWTISNFNNNNNGWTYIKCGGKKGAFVGSIRVGALPVKVSKIDVTVTGFTDTYVNKTYLEVASDSDFTKDVQKVEVAIAKGVLSYIVPSKVTNAYYRVSYDCKQHASANGLVVINKVEIYQFDDSRPSNPSITPGSCNIYEATEVTITAPDAGSEIYYSTDSVNFSKYTAPVSISATTNLYAYAEKAGAKSDIVKATYTMAKSYASLDALLTETPTAAGWPVIVPIKDEQITGFYTTKYGSTEYKNGVYIDRQVGGKDFELYASNVPEDWSIGDKLYGIAKGIYIQYNGQWVISLVNWESLSISKVKAPTIDFNTETHTVTITSDSADDIIYYTTDGSTPTDASILYEYPFIINKTEVVKAICVSEEGVSSEVTKKICSPYNNNEIRYTSSNGLVISPNKSSDFGANIISNTYTDSIGTIVFDGDITNIGNSAFSNCINLNSITIPNSVTSIGENAFYGCTSLPVIDNIRYADTYLVEATDKTLSSYTFKEGTKWIGHNAFQDCTNLLAIVLPASLHAISSSAFSGCSNLKIAVLPSNLKSIDASAFSNCSNLTSINIPNAVTRIDNSAFSGCSSLKSVQINSLESWCKIKFGNGDANPTTYAHKLSLNNVELTEAVIPSTIDTINAYVFNNCSNLTSVIIPNSVMSIGNSAFSGCSSLSAVHINSIESWCKIKFEGETANPITYAHKLFLNNVELTEVVIPFAIKAINNYAFSSCSSLTSVTIPNSVTSIGAYAFNGCSSLGSINIPNSVTNIGEYAFNGCSSLISITISNSVKSLNGHTFCSCKNLTSITLSDSLISMGDVEFAGCSSLTSLTIPGSVKTISGYQMFYDCSNLKSLTILAKQPPVVTRLSGSFWYGASVKSIHVYEGLKSIYEADDVWSWNNMEIIDDVPTVRATSLTMNSSTYFCSLYGYLQPSATVNKEATLSSLTWESSDPSVLVVMDASTGQSLGLKEGVATITARTIDGSNLSASATVYVGTYYPVTSITLSQTSGTLEINKTLTLTATVLPENATAKSVKWTSSNTEIATVSAEGVVMALAPGTATITATSIDGTNIKATCEITVPEFNVKYTDAAGQEICRYLASGDDAAINDAFKRLEMLQPIENVNVTYTRSFDSKMVNNWQAWFMPFDVDYDDMSDAYEVAQIYGVLMDKAGVPYIAFQKMTEGLVKANVPYAVRVKEVGDAVISTTTTLQQTANTNTFSVQSTANNFTFGGVYENSYLSAEYPTYALNKSGNFTLMGSDVYLRPFRIYMRITDREDNPYAAVTAPQEVKVVVLGEDETSIENVDADVDVDGEIYNLGGQKLQKLQKGINIVNGKKVLY